ncbi:ATP synthase subunit g, mitochondrial [Contarinia nasturtii]|uniref:ATP synthase subunit g, mitochondrial n=1 Tax=Contarinia nasturtii TaxID=265458 RepID=UPI0012D40DEB|nr:ATP synthase subunit g, mitochondrial [Contarinia nasturtii]
MAAVAKLSVLVNNLVVASRPKLKVAAKYAMAEMTPPKVSDIPAISSGLGKLVSGAKSGAWKNTTVREAFLNTLVTIEVLCWFFVGECIGKRHFVGYDV